MDSPEKSVPSKTGETSVVGNNEPTTSYMLGGITGKGFLPGVSGNPSGRPKSTPITDLLREIFEDRDFVKHELRGILTGKSAIAKVMLTEKAAERLEGKVVQPVEAEI